MRDAFIPARKAELFTALLADEADGGDLLARLFQLIAAVLHYEAGETLERLKTLYAPLDPDRGRRPPAPPETATAFEAAFSEALSHGNFVGIDHRGAVSAAATRALTGLSVKASEFGIRSVAFFARGARDETYERKIFMGLGRRRIETQTYSEVIVLVAFKTLDEMSPREQRAFAATRRGARPGTTLIKHFRNVAHAELLTLHPGARPTMLRRDQLMLAAPALIGGAPIVIQLAPAIVVLFTVLTAFFGARAAIDNSALQRALAGVSALIALGAFVMRQWMKYERQTLKYQKQLSDTVYFRNAANNESVLDSLIGAGEDQDAKEACLAYWALARAGKPLTAEEVDAAVETALRARIGLDSDFEVADALAKLQRLQLATPDEDRYAAVPTSEALARLDAAWDSYFRYART